MRAASEGRLLLYKGKLFRAKIVHVNNSKSNAEELFTRTKEYPSEKSLLEEALLKQE